MGDEKIKIGILESDNIPDDSLLGYLVGIVHHKFRMSQEKMDELLLKSKLPEKYWPNKPKPIPSFQAACRTLESPRYLEKTFRDPGTMLDIKVGMEFMVDVLSDGSRQLTRKIHYPESLKASPEMQKILRVYVISTQKEPEKMAKFIYDDVTDTIKRINLYENEDSLSIGEMTDRKYGDLIEEFNNIRNCYTERYMKDAWFRMLRAEGAIPWLKNCGSLWFIPKDAKQYVESFGSIYGEIHGVYGTWRAVPIIDTEQHRKYLKEDVTAEYNERFKTFLNNVAKKMESGMDADKMREQLRESKSKFENKLNKELIEKYNNLLNMSIKAKCEDIKVGFESSRLEKAREMLANL
jgi:hypothetical protein